MRGFLAPLLFLFLTACTPSNETSIRVLEDNGFTSVRLGGFAFFGCSEGDSLTMNFEAIGPTGRPVSGVLCCGMVFKSCTVRMD
jgi:hypothetical protein